MSLVHRRTLLLAGCAAGTGCASPRGARASAVVPPGAAGDRRFSIIYEGNRIGAHTVFYSPDTSDVRVDTEIRMLVKLGFLTVYAFRHRSSETWRAGRLVSLAGETVDRGQTLRIEGAATPLGFRVMSKGGPFLAPAETLTSNTLWSPAILEQATLVDAQYGGVIGVSARRLADEQVTIAGRAIRATRHSFITPYLAGSIWYDEQSLWVHGQFERDGSKIEYRLDA